VAEMLVGDSRAIKRESTHMEISAIDRSICGGTQSAGKRE
jgi:hypothetical protein